MKATRPRFIFLRTSRLENAASAGARWYPLPADYADPRPVYVSMVPTWADFTAMNWYTGMNYYGGMWGYAPTRLMWIPISAVTIAGRSYTPNTYMVYSASHPGSRTATHFNYYPYTPRNPVVRTGKPPVSPNNGRGTSPVLDGRAPRTARPNCRRVKSRRRARPCRSNARLRHNARPLYNVRLRRNVSFRFIRRNLPARAVVPGNFTVNKVCVAAIACLWRPNPSLQRTSPTWHFSL